MNEKNIDWSKYGHAPKPAGWALEFSGDGMRLFCRASFSIDEWEAVKAQIEAQLAYWKSEDGK
ncbi:hypothetical protein ACQUFY_04545 [Robbsia andropogonis]|uniref:hypothetical protein n=1 Tax=Robbsia andropogonis TaxID=28092 RepID=UPI003D207D0D